jgi:serine/threonine protein kinase
MKIIKIPSSTSDVKKIEDIVATTRQEIKCLRICRKNPNIIKFEDVIGDIKNNKIYIILELCNNGDLPSFF